MLCARLYLASYVDCPGGELFYYLKSVKRMSEEEARFYFIEILYGLMYLHQQNIIYRDLKPENLLINHDGHVKIADFGLSKVGLEAREVTYSFCGSTEYMPPEMIQKTGHSYGVDFYTLGALLYELVTGLPPFYSRN
jgi:serum/glucocorticoid-regulated kinase 2